MKKIMFNDRYNLTESVLSGKKTMTRRLIKTPRIFKGEDVNGYWVYRSALTNEICEICMKDYDDMAIEGGQIFPKYNIDEVVAIAQSYKTIADNHPDVDTFILNVSKAHNIEMYDAHKLPGWTNKMFVKAELMPRHIKITDIYPQKLQDISDEDCLKEGIFQMPDGGNFKPFAFYDNLIKVKNNIEGVTFGYYKDFDTPKEAFANLIDCTSGKGTWDNNAYVFVYAFELIY